jgi:hypothetical protein
MSPVPPPVASPSAGGSTPVAPPRLNRVSRPAKFIAAEATETRVQLGADGRLPELSLRDEKQKPAVEKQKQNANPLLLIGAVCVSVTMSVVMLLADTGMTQGNDRAKKEARQQIKSWYTANPTVPGALPRDPKPFEEILRLAIQASHVEHYEEERELYREVLNMLKDESNQDVGLTGLHEAPVPPNDRHLEGLLSILLSPD